MMLRAYQIFGVVVLSALAFADYRGWAPGTEESTEPAAANEQGSGSGRSSSGYRGTRNDGTIRNRTYRGGK